MYWNNGPGRTAVGHDLPASLGAVNPGSILFVFSCRSVCPWTCIQLQTAYCSGENKWKRGKENMKQGTQVSTHPPDVRVRIIVHFTLERKGRLKELNKPAWGHSWLVAVPGYKPESVWLQSLWALVTISIPRVTSFLLFDCQVVINLQLPHVLSFQLPSPTHINTEQALLCISWSAVIFSLQMSVPLLVL